MISPAVARLAQALQEGKLPDAQPWDIGAAVRSIADSLVGESIAVQGVRAATQVLNKYGHYEHTRMLGQAWRDCRGFDPTIAKHHAQALINLSALDAAEGLLQDALAQSSASSSAQAVTEIPEYEGLRGRIEKQRFVLTKDKDFLVKATDQYLKQYQADSARFWHGINVVALLAREEREGLRGYHKLSSSELAAAIFKQVASVDASADPWIAATASEASLALDNCDQAELWLYRFLHHPKVKPFDVESYDRQVREIWEGSASASGSRCADRLAAIMSRHIARTLRQWSVSPSEVSAVARAIESNREAFEKNFLGEASFSVEAVRRMLGTCSSVGCVINKQLERLGTGFLIQGDWLKASFGPQPVFVTNAHVISDVVPNAIRTTEASVTFEVESAQAGKPIVYKVREVLFTSLPGDLGVSSAAKDNLDVTVARLEPLPSQCHSLTAAAQLPLIEDKAKAYVVGHPRGSGLQISLHDSRLLDIDDDERLIHYRTPTDPGSSGSPVFNAAWEVIGVHHAGSSKTPRLHGSGSYEANEAIALRAVRLKLNG
jgi:V8-like Glu-specific endopeptidase